MGHFGRLLVFAIGAAACNALTGADALDDPSANGSSSGATSSGSAGAPDGFGSPPGRDVPVTSGTDGGTSQDSAARADAAVDASPEDTPVVQETFGSAGACTGIKTTNGALTTYEPNGRTGGACTICAVVAGGMFLEVTATMPVSDSASVEAYARQVTGHTTPSTASVRLVVEGTSSSSQSIGAAWTRVKGSSVSVKKGAVIVAQAGVANAAIGDCVVIDDLRVTLK